MNANSCFKLSPGFSICHFNAFRSFLYTLAWIQLLDVSAAAAFIRAGTSPTFTPAQYWGSIGKWTGGGSLEYAPTSRNGFSLSHAEAYPKLDFTAYVSLTTAYPGSLGIMMKGGGEVKFSTNVGVSGMQEGPNVIADAFFFFQFVPNPNYSGNPITTIPGTVKIPHSFKATGTAPSGYGNADFYFTLTRVTLTGQRSKLLDAHMRLESESQTVMLTLSGALSYDSAFVTAFEAANHQEFHMDFEPNIKYQVEMSARGGAVVFGDPDSFPTASFEFAAGPGLEVDDDGIPYDQAFYLQVSPAVMETPVPGPSLGNGEVVINWLAPPDMYLLEVSLNPFGQGWEPSTAEVSSSLDLNSVVLPAPEHAIFYRLLEQQP